MMEGLIFVAALVLAFATLPVVALSALGPVSQAAGAINAPTRFQLADLLWLLVLLQAALAACVQVIGVRLEGFGWACAFFSVIVLAIWGAGVSVLSRAGVISTWKRGCLLLLALPGTLALMLGFAIGIVSAAGASLTYYHQIEEGDRIFDPYYVARVSASGVAALCVLVGLAYGMRRLSIWIAGDFISATEKLARD